MNASSGGSGSSGRGSGGVLEPRVLREYALVADGERGVTLSRDISLGGA
jgi:hypothetical protein